MASRADEVEALVIRMEGTRPLDDSVIVYARHLLRSYTALLREDRCAPLVAFAELCVARRFVSADEVEHAARDAFARFLNDEGGERDE